MSKIICECGHHWNTHDGEGCSYCEWGENGKFNACPCNSPRLLVEARYWARRMMQERDAIKAKTQEQSEYIQRDWASPAEKLGMLDKIEKLTAERDGARQMYDLVVTDLHHWKGEFAASNGYFWRMMRERDAIQAKAQEQAEMIQRDCTSPYEVSEMLSTIARMADEFEKVKAERDELRLALTNTKFRSRETWQWKDVEDG